MDQKDANGSIYMSSTTIFALHQSLALIPGNNQYDFHDYYSTNYSSGSSTSNNSEYQGRYNQSNCQCVIDLSTPATLERDFYAWLNGVNPNTSRNTPCIFATPSTPYITDYATTSTTESNNTSPSLICNNSITSHSPNALSDANSSYTVEAAKPKGKRKKKEAKERTNTYVRRGTNLYGRPYCPGRPLQIEERVQIIQLFHAGMKVNAISKQLCISHGCVSKIISRFRETGLLMPSSHSECRRRKRLQQIQVESLYPYNCVKVESAD